MQDIFTNYISLHLMNQLHKDIKTYSFSEMAQQFSDFALKRIEDVYRTTNGAPDVPHRHDYYTILFIEKG
jgi:AraC family transcriptional regulator, transcriptional activator of pobA